jgi:hypothetical protein
MVAFAVELEALDDGVFLRLIDEAGFANLPDVGRFHGLEAGRKPGWGVN